MNLKNILILAVIVIVIIVGFVGLSVWHASKMVDQQDILDTAVNGLCGGGQDAACNDQWMNDAPSIVRDGDNKADVYFPTQGGDIHAKLAVSTAGNWIFLGWSTEGSGTE